MVQRSTAWFPVLLLAAMAAVTVWLNQQVQPAERARDDSARHDPDYIVENLSATRIGPDGFPHYTLSARRMVHYPDDDTTHLEAPRFVNLGSSGAPVTVTSDSATLSSNGESAYLSGNVRLVRSAYAGNSELTVRTSWLHVIPDDNFARTDRPVEISDAHTMVTSVGLEFNSQSQILKLLSKVRGRYEKLRQTR